MQPRVVGIPTSTNILGNALTFQASHLDWRYIRCQRRLQARSDFIPVSAGSGKVFVCDKQALCDLSIDSFGLASAAKAPLRIRQRAATELVLAVRL